MSGTDPKWVVATRNLFSAAEAEYAPSLTIRITQDALNKAEGVQRYILLRDLIEGINEQLGENAVDLTSLPEVTDDEHDKDEIRKLIDKKFVSVAEEVTVTIIELTDQAKNDLSPEAVERQIELLEGQLKDALSAVPDDLVRVLRQWKCVEPFTGEALDKLLKRQRDGISNPSHVAKCEELLGRDRKIGGSGQTISFFLKEFEKKLRDAKKTTPPKPESDGEGGTEPTKPKETETPTERVQDDEPKEGMDRRIVSVAVAAVIAIGALCAWWLELVPLGA